MEPSTTLTGVFKPALLRWQLRQLFAINVIAVLVASLYVLFRTEPLIAPGEVSVLVAVFVHSGLIVWTLGRVTTRQTGFLYTLGFTRDQICWQTLMASAISGLLVCFTGWLLMLTGLRSAGSGSLVSECVFPIHLPGGILPALGLADRIRGRAAVDALRLDSCQPAHARWSEWLDPANPRAVLSGLVV